MKEMYLMSDHVHRNAYKLELSAKLFVNKNQFEVAIARNTKINIIYITIHLGPS